MRKHVNDLEWWSVLTGRFHVGISESFLREISDYLDWNWVMHNNKFLSKEVVREFRKELYTDIFEDDDFNLEKWISENIPVVDEDEL